MWYMDRLRGLQGSVNVAAVIVALGIFVIDCAKAYAIIKKANRNG